MSHYNDFETEITDQNALVRALCRMNNAHNQTIQQNWIELHDKATHLYGYKGDRRQQTAHVVIRKNNVGNAANDLGFVRNEDGRYGAIISDYDRNHFNNQWCNKLYTYYNIEKSKIELENKGIEYTECKDDVGRIQLRAKFKTSEKQSRIKVRG